ncbi:MAG: HD domain-containing protein, partial [Anaerolineae bacterium]|nr:HD domain-containing protein [Anaerolineae bacterium]
MSDWRYRLGQMRRALTAFMTPVDEAAAEAVLAPELMHLFRRMRRSEQLHSLRVMHLLRAQGHTNRDLLTAALLHDCGKSRVAFALAGRVAVVIGAKLFPRRV